MSASHPLSPPPHRFRLDPDSRAQATERRRHQRALESAIKAERFTLQFQPTVALHTNAVTGAEAQLRWPYGKTGISQPASFRPLAEQTGQIVPIGGWALLRACTEAASLGSPQSWPADWTLAVAVSHRQIAEGAALHQVATALQQSALPAERLDLLLPEHHLGEFSLDSLLTLSALRDLGVGITLDAFGTGAANLTCLKRLPLTAIRLDRSLIRDLPNSHADTAILRALIQTGHALGLRVGATGVETEPQRAALAAAGCDEAQGSFLGHPLPGTLLKPSMTKA